MQDCNLARIISRYCLPQCFCLAFLAFLVCGWFTFFRPHVLFLCVGLVVFFVVYITHAASHNKSVDLLM